MNALRSIGQFLIHVVFIRPGPGGALNIHNNIETIETRTGGGESATPITWDDLCCATAAGKHSTNKTLIGISHFVSEKSKKTMIDDFEVTKNTSFPELTSTPSTYNKLLTGVFKD